MAAAVAGAARRADPGARAGALRVRQAVRRQGAAVLAGLRPASCSASRTARPSTACRWSRWAATCACWARIRASRSRPIDRPRALAGEAAVAALHGRHRGAGVQPAAAAADLLRPLRGPAHVAAADDRDGAARPARRRPPGLLPGDKVEAVDGQPRPLLGRAGTTSSPIRRARRCGSGSAAAPTPRSATSRRSSIERSGPLHAQERVGWIGVSPRFHLPEIGVLDPASPAAQAGLKTFDFITAVNGVPVGDLDRVRARRSNARARRRCGSTTCAAAIRRCRSRTSRSRSPGSAVVIPVAGLRRHRAPPLRDRHPVGRAVRVLRRARQPGRPDRPAPRRSDPRAGRRAAAALGSCCASGWPATPTTDFPAWAGSRRAAAPRGQLPPGGPLASWTPTARRSSTWCSAPSTAWPGRPMPPVPITQPVRLRGQPRVRAHGADHRRDDLRLRRDRARARAADDAGRADHDRLRGRRRGRAGLRPVPVADGAASASTWRC